ncbi:hypothetical protein NQ176_g5379 [Zarea fungicola]|uniref:Uncharacterized protein n=1 Tax=Zarea fungicola TaxID=93591 RepID=A0ACC1NAQ6_9HYPO|nr:hypothetical protein NQ176_g5379 [Lecanicillium fungicola]
MAGQHDHEAAAVRANESGHESGNEGNLAADSSANKQKETLPKTSTHEHAPLETFIEVPENDDTPVTSKWEIWSWYMYYVGANGLSLFNFGPTAFQNLLSQAAEPSGLLDFAGRKRDVNSIVLVCNGIAFAIQVVLFLLIGAYADFGTWRPYILLVWSIIAYGIGFGWIAVHDPENWRTGVGLYIVGIIAYQITLTYWTAAFPSLARNTQYLRDSRVAFRSGDISQQELDRRDEMERSRLSNESFWAQSVGEIVILAILVGVMFGVKVDDSVEKNNWGLSVAIVYSTACWLALSIGWFVLEKKRPGMTVPPGLNIVTVGFWQLYEAGSQIWQLKQTVIFLIGYFWLGDSLNTTVTVIATLQYQVVSYNTLTLTYMLIVGIFTQAVGIGGFWLLQKYFKISAKTMFIAVVIFIVLLDGWGMIGNWSDDFGFHSTWEFWAYGALYGLLVCPWYSYSQIMISSVTPRGYEFLFFSVFNIVGKSSSFVGPFISSAIIDDTPGGQNNNAAFYLFVALSVLSLAFIWYFLDLEKSAREQEAFLERKRAHMANMSSSLGVSGSMKKIEEP